jgi:hypothetical protein
MLVMHVSKSTNIKDQPIISFFSILQTTDRTPLLGVSTHLLLCASTVLAHTTPANGRHNQRKQPPSILQVHPSLPCTKTRQLF